MRSPEVRRASIQRPPRRRYLMLTFREYVALREGLLLPDRPPSPGLPRINTTPFTNRRRTRSATARMAKVARGKVARPRMAKVVRAPVA